MQNLTSFMQLNSTLQYGDLSVLKAMWMNQSFPGPVAGFESKDDSNNVLRLIASYDF